MISSAVTISLVQEAEGGPFVFWHDFPGSVRLAKDLGFDAVEIFAPHGEFVNRPELRGLLDETGLKCAAVGTGAGMVIHKLSLIDLDSARRHQALEFVKRIIEFGGEFQAPAIIGSMQGRATPELPRPEALKRLAESLTELGEYAEQFGVPLIYEPLNRYETNLCATMAQGVELLTAHSIKNVVLLADLFHMNIEEQSLADGLRSGGQHIGHVHFVDSNRRPAGNGHIDFGAVRDALNEIGYTGFLSAEAFAWPDSETAARQTLTTYRKFFAVA